MVETRIFKKLVQASDGTSLGVLGAVNQASYPRVHNRSGTHRTRLKRHVQGRIMEAPPPEPTSGISDSEGLRVSERVTVDLAPVVALADHRATHNHESAHRDLLYGRGFVGEHQGSGHECTVGLGKARGDDHDLAPLSATAPDGAFRDGTSPALGVRRQRFVTLGHGGRGPLSGQGGEPGTIPGDSDQVELGAWALRPRSRRLLFPLYGRPVLVHRSTLKTAHSLLDRFFRDAEGRTDHVLDVGFLASDLGLSPERLEPALAFLVSRGLITAVGAEVAYLTGDGIRATVEEVDLAALGPARAFAQSTPARARSSETPASSPHGPATEPEVEASDPVLVHVTVDGRTSSVRLGERCTIGRVPENDVTIDDKRASKRHAVVRRDEHGFVLEDLESANGTLLNGSYCVEPTRLAPDDEIVIGRTMLVFQAPPDYARSSVARRKPSVSEDLADPDIKVVRGTPARVGAIEESSADLFREDSGPQTAENVFPTEDHIEVERLRLEPEATGPDDRFEDLQPTVLGAHPPGDELHIDEPSPEVLELHDIVAPPSTLDASIEETEGPDAPPLIQPERLSPWSDSSDGVSPFEAPSEPVPFDDERTVTMSLDQHAESLPVAPAQAPGGSVDLDAGASPPPQLLLSLLRLRAHVVDIAGPESSPLLDAIDAILAHPLARAFAEEEESS